jgi:hypothetical protein
MSNNPNAVVGGGIPGSVAAILFVLRVAGVEIPDPPLEAGIAIGAVLSGTVLLIGRRGIKGVIGLVWKGSGA